MYTISDLERVSDVKAHTIRIWEKRYALFNPKRTKGNHRLYGDEDLLRLLNVNRMVKAGNRVSVVAKWNPDEMTNQIAKLENSKDVSFSDKEYYTDEILAAAMAYDENRFERVFDIIDRKNDFSEVWYEYLVPVLVRIGDLWISKRMCPAQEHFLSHLIERKICSKIDELEEPKKDSDLFLLFLPSGEAHELGLLMSFFCIKNAGFKVIYLGSNVPIQNVEIFESEYKPAVLLTYINGMKISKNFKRFLNKSDELSSEVVLAGHLNGHDKKDLLDSKRIVYIDSVSAIESYLSVRKRKID